MREDEAIEESTGHPAILIFWMTILLWLFASAGFYLALAYAGPGDLFLLFGPFAALKFILWIAVPGLAALVALARFRRGAYLAALAPLAVLPVALALYLHGPALGTWMRFEVERPGYLARIETVRNGGTDAAVAPGTPLIAFFSWGNALLDEDGVVYDEADSMAQPPELRRQQWQARAVPGFLRCGGPVMPLGGHFYWAAFDC